MRRASETLAVQKTMTLGRAIATVGGFTLLSRIVGFLRDVVLSAMLGSGALADAFFVAFKLPNFFRRLFAEGAFSAAFVPLFARELQAHGREQAVTFARQAHSALLLVLLPFTALLILFMPGVMVTVLFAYVIPGLGTNWLKLWEFNTRLRLGRFRAQHGFVFGSATSLFALLCMEPQAPALGWFELGRAGFIMGSVLAFWNWLYDVYAIKAGLIVVYNRPYAKRQGPEAIATAYAPVFFGTFGACYGMALSIFRYELLERGCRDCFWPLFVGGACAALIMPVSMFVLMRFRLMFVTMLVFVTVFRSVMMMLVFEMHIESRA